MITSIILCAGKNSRLANHRNKIVKPLIKFKGKTLLEHHLDNTKKLKNNKNFINVYKNQKLFYKLKKEKKLTFQIIKEKKLLGTAGVVISNLTNFTDVLLILYGDNYLNFDIKKFYRYFINNDCNLLIGVFKKKDLSISGSANFNNKNQLINFKEKDIKLKKKTGFCNAGLYLIKKSYLKKFKKNNFLDFGRDIFLKKNFDEKCKIYRIKSCLAFDTIKLYKKNLVNS